MRKSREQTRLGPHGLNEDFTWEHHSLSLCLLFFYHSHPNLFLQVAIKKQNKTQNPQLNLERSLLQFIMYVILSILKLERNMRWGEVGSGLSSPDCPWRSPCPLVVLSSSCNGALSSTQPQAQAQNLFGFPLHS